MTESLNTSSAEIMVGSIRKRMDRTNVRWRLGDGNGAT